MKFYQHPELELRVAERTDLLTSSGLTLEASGFGDEIDFEDFLN